MLGLPSVSTIESITNKNSEEASRVRDMVKILHGSARVYWAERPITRYSQAL